MREGSDGEMAEMEAVHLLGSCSWGQWQNYLLKLSARSGHPWKQAADTAPTEAVILILKASRKEILMGMKSSWKMFLPPGCCTLAGKP